MEINIQRGQHLHKTNPRSVTTETTPLSLCKELYFEQTIDHFGPSPGTFRQRYFVSDKYYQNNKNNKTNNNNKATMFFYLGNEADVTLYVNHTGLMWENAEEFGALLVFAEHRYYGKSTVNVNPNSNDINNNITNRLKYLSSDQALMDYVVLIRHLQEVYEMRGPNKHYNSDAAATTIPTVIGFGGSYGGMLASWARIRYPHVWDGVIASSAPILAFEGLEDYLVDGPNFFHQRLLYDVTNLANNNSTSFCATNLRKAFVEKTLSKVVPDILRRGFLVCPNDTTSDENLAENLMDWLNNAISYMAMGNYPYPSGYILNGNGILPAFPISVACEHLAQKEFDLTKADQLDEWMAGLAAFAGIYYNHTHDRTCNTISRPVNNESSVVETLWDYQYCTQLFMVGGQGPDRYDIYWNESWDGNAASQRCRTKYDGVFPNRHHIADTYGTPQDWKRLGISNIVWSQGEYDPWRGGGMVPTTITTTTRKTDSLRSPMPLPNYENSSSRDDDEITLLVTLDIPKGAHHLDLFFSHPDDPPKVVAVRKREVEEIRKWIDQKQQDLQHSNLRNQIPKPR